MGGRTDCGDQGTEGRITMLVKIYTDGAARGNPDGPGGYGTILSYTKSERTDPYTGAFPGV